MAGRDLIEGARDVVGISVTAQEQVVEQPDDLLAELLGNRAGDVAVGATEPA